MDELGLAAGQVVFAVINASDVMIGVPYSVSVAPVGGAEAKALRIASALRDLLRLLADST